MALFSSKKNTGVSKIKATKGKKVTSPEIKHEVSEVSHSSGFSVILNPRITEKSTEKSEKGVYTFDVARKATKSSVKSAIKAIFKVTPRKVTVVPTRSKVILSRGKRGKTASGKKAYVYLKKGDTIEFV